MSLINTTGLTKSLSKLGNAVVFTVQPVANLLEMASESSLAWSESHAADLAAKTERRNKVREQTNRDLLRKALADADRATIETNALTRQVETLVDIDSVKGRIHETKRAAVKAISQDVIDQLTTKNNLTDADILRAAKVGTLATTTEETNEPKSNFDIGSFTSK